MALYHAATLAIGNQGDGDIPAAFLEAAQVEQGLVIGMGGDEQHPEG
jgi:hypothetical protein